MGPGALGCLFAAILGRSGHQVWLLDHRAERASFIAAQGIALHDQQGKSMVPVQATNDPARIGSAPLIFLSVKADAVAGAARTVLPILGADGLLIALQNGIAHHSCLADIFHQPWALGITAQGANLLGPGIVRHGGSGLTSLGFLEKVDASAQARLQETAVLLSRAGIATAICPDILAAAWNKLIVNAGINALTALEGCANGELLHRPAALATLTAAVREAAQVATACGIKIVADPLAMTVGVCRETAENISSMLQDIRQGRQTEVEAINGMIVRQAAKLGLPAPINQALWAGVKALESRPLQEEGLPGSA